MITLGIDLGGTKIAAALVEDGRILARERIATPSGGQVAVFDAMAATATRLMGSGGPAERVGVGSPGPLDLDGGRVLFAPNIPGMEGAPIVTALAERLGLPVVLENDANAAGYAEHLYGAAGDCDVSVYVTLSTGIGGGLFVGDRVLHGAHGVAGEIGHVTVLPGGPVGGEGHDGSLEALASGRAIARDGTFALGRPVDTAEVVDLAAAGDAKAERIVANAARFTGIGLANLVKVFDPDAFVVGGGLAAAEGYLARIDAAMRDYLHGWPMPPLRPARLGTDAGVVGAAAVAARG